MKWINPVPRRLAAALAILLVATAVYAAVTLGPFQANLTVREPLSVSPGSIDITVFAGDSTTATFTVHNDASVTINTQVVVSIEAPAEGNAADISVSGQGPLAAAPGDTALQLDITVSQSAVAGTYTLSVTVTR